MKILYISNKPIYPKIDGGCVAMHNFLSCLLETGNQIKHFTFSTHKHTFDLNNYPITISEKILPEGISIDTKVKPKNAFFNLFNKTSYNINRFYSKEAEVKIRKEIRTENYDIIILESVFLSSYIRVIKKNSNAKIYLRSHNVEFKIWEKLGGNEKKVFKKIYLKKLAKDLKFNEIKALSEVDVILTISEDDKRTFKNLGLKTTIETIPVAVKTSAAIKNYNHSSFFHIGAMNWQPNIEAVNYLSSKIFPIILESQKEAKLTLAGSFMKESTLENKNNAIVNVGFVENVDEFIAEQGILLAPILSGSGVRIKILESMAIGTPVVTTILGAEGLNVTSEKEIFIAKNQEEFIEYSLKLSNSEALRKEIGEKAKTYIQANHNKNIVIKKLSEIIEGRA